MKILDFSAMLPTARALKDAGVGGVMLYCSPPREQWMRAKQPPRAYLDALDVAGIKYGFVWQYGGAANPDAMRGRTGGRLDATAAQAYLDSVGRGDRPVVFAVDFDASLAQWNNNIVDYFRGAVEVLGRQRVGIYSHSRAVAWAAEDAVVATVAPGRVLGWVTRSWGSTGFEAYSTLYQHTHNVTGPDGVKVDENRELHKDWGWRPLPAPKVPAKLVDAVPAPRIVTWTDRFGFGGPRPVAGVVYVFIHVTVNTPGTPAENVATYQITSQSGSYHTLVDMKKLLRENTADWVVWATGNKGNFNGMHLSYVAMGTETRAQWLGELRQMLLMGAWEVANWCHKHGIRTVVVDGQGLLRGETGISTHKATRIWGGTDHVDPGEGFPMDVLASTVNDYLGLMAATTTEEGDSIMSHLSENEQRQVFDAVIETRNLTRDIHRALVEPQTSMVEGSTFKTNAAGYIKLIDRKVEELHQAYASKSSVAQELADALQARNDAGEATEAEHGTPDEGVAK
ncbi:DUF1906 domain-containing protein [Corynebacterium phoceense]|uniref:DUF1906 domain-containing protein n=1 Tax=Corynebacterium phoceense TaxID=1686286 RepID=UPI00211CB7E4|nr:DUF1906 domain-containing protein [Corynebacterium phoceense]MCQ9345849.1 DUF1906 domain-containing protein [Corynebacterium phoceense]